MRQSVEVIEIQIDYCPLVFGVGACTASLSVGTRSKCYNTYKTCRKTSSYQKSVKTLRFVKPGVQYPVGEIAFPLIKSVDVRSPYANMQGDDKRYKKLGVRGTMSVNMVNITTDDRFFDKYVDDRLSGAANLNGLPSDVTGTFWGKLLARNYYINRPIIYKSGYIEDGVLTIEREMVYNITDIVYNDTSGVTINAQDIITRLEGLFPSPSSGSITSEISETYTGNVSLQPSGVGSEYPSNGFASIGSELVSYTRSGDTVNIKARGLRGTEASTHSISDTFQATYSPRSVRIDQVIYDICTGSGLPVELLDTANWDEEISSYASSLYLSADILKPEKAITLIGELTDLGVAIWADEQTGKIKVKVDRPDFERSGAEFDDRISNIKATKVTHNDLRANLVIYLSDQVDPSKGMDKDNFSKVNASADVASSTDNAYGDVRSLVRKTRWLNDSSGDAIARTLANRMLRKYTNAPATYTVEVDKKDYQRVGDYVNFSSMINEDENGVNTPTPTQVNSVSMTRDGSVAVLTLSDTGWNGRFAVITPDVHPTFQDSTDEERERWAYVSDDIGFMFDGSEGPKIF